MSDVLSKTEANHMLAGNVQICLQIGSHKSKYLQVAIGVFKPAHPACQRVFTCEKYKNITRN